MELINILKTLNFEAIFDIKQVTLEGTDDSSAFLIRGEVKSALQKESDIDTTICDLYSKLEATLQKESEDARIDDTLSSYLYYNDDEEVYLKYTDWGFYLTQVKY